MNKKKIAVIVSVGIMILLVTSIIIASLRDSFDTPGRLLSLGEKYLTELNYEQALVQFLKVIEIDPMNPRGYTGAAEAYIGLDRTEDAIAVLRQGHERTGDKGIRDILDELLADSENVEKETEIQLHDPINEQQTLSPAELAEREPWKLFDNMLRADEVVLGGLPLWECTLDSVAASYPGGAWSADGRIYFSDVQFSIDGNHVYLGYLSEQQATEFRTLHKGMDIDAALNALGLSYDGISFVNEMGNSIVFNIDNSGCFAVDVNLGSPYDLDIAFCYTNIIAYDYMLFIVGFNDGVLDFIEASLRSYDESIADTTDASNESVVTNDETPSDLILAVNTSQPTNPDQAAEDTQGYSDLSSSETEESSAVSTLVITIENKYEVDIDLSGISVYVDESKIVSLEQAERCLSQIPTELHEALIAYLNSKNKKLKISFEKLVGGGFPNGRYVFGENRIILAGGGSVLVHEYGHMLHDVLNEVYGSTKFTEEWTTLNSGQVYGKDASDYNTLVIGTIFIDQYSSSDIYEDVAVIFDTFVTGSGYSYVENYRDSAIWEKAKLLNEICKASLKTSNIFQIS